MIDKGYYKDIPQLAKPKGHERQGFRGEAAAASDAAAGRDGGRSDTGSASGRGDGPSSDARDRAMGLQGKTGIVDKSLGTGPLGVDRSAVGQFSQFGRNVMQQNLRPSFVDRLKGMGSNIFGGILGLLNPALGFAYKGIGSLKNLGQYDTLADYFRGEFGQTEDEEDQVQTFDLGPSRNPMASYMPSTPAGIMGVNLGTLPMQRDLVKTGRLQEFQNVPSAAPEDYDFTGFEDAMAFNPGSIKDRALKQQFNIYNATGIVTPNMKKLMQEDIEQNQKKGTPLSLPAKAYTLIS